MAYCFPAIGTRNAALTTALKKQPDLGNFLNALDTADHCSCFYTGWSGSASGLPGLSTHPGCGFPHISKTWCTPIFFTPKKNPDRVITSSITECIFCNIFDSMYWKYHCKKIFKSKNTGKRFAGITFYFEIDSTLYNNNNNK